MHVSPWLRRTQWSLSLALWPWACGCRDNLEDELRVVESGCEGVLRVVWDDHEAAAPSFPQVRDGMALCRVCKLPGAWPFWG